MEANLVGIKMGEIEVFRWKKPSSNWIKINVDASFILCSATSSFVIAVSPLHVELNVVVDGLILVE